MQDNLCQKEDLETIQFTPESKQIQLCGVALGLTQQRMEVPEPFWATFSYQNFFLISNWNFLSQIITMFFSKSLCLSCPIYYLHVRLKAKVSFPAPQIFSSSLKKANSSTITSFIVCSRSLIILVRLHWGCLQDNLGKHQVKF